MKKVISTVVAFALAGVMAVSAFAAGSGYTKDQLKQVAADNISVATSNGVDVSLAEVNSAIDALTAPEEVDVHAIKVAAENAKSAISAAKSEKAIKDIVNNAVSEVKAAMGSNDVALDGLTVELTVSGQAKISGKVTVCGTSVNVKSETKAVAPEWTDDSKKDQNGNSANSAAAAAPATAGSSVIKATGMNTASVAVVALSVVAVLGVAAVKARKLGE